MSHYLRVYLALERNAIRLEIAIEIVTTYVEGKARRYTKQPFQRLRLDLHRFKLALRHGVAAVGTIPVAEINQLAPLGSGDTPVGDFMQRAGVIAVGEHHAVIAEFLIGGEVVGLVIDLQLAGLKIVKILAVENLDQLRIVVSTHCSLLQKFHVLRRVNIKIQLNRW